MNPTTMTMTSSKDGSRSALADELDLGLSQAIELVAVATEARKAGLRHVERSTYDQLTTICTRYRMWPEALLAAQLAGLSPSSCPEGESSNLDVDARVIEIASQIDGYPSENEERSAMSELACACATAALLRFDLAARTSGVARRASRAAVGERNRRAGSLEPGTSNAPDTEVSYAAFRARALSALHSARVRVRDERSDASALARLVELFCEDELDTRLVSCLLATFESETVALLCSRLHNSTELPTDSVGFLLEWVATNEQERRILAMRLLARGGYPLIANAVLLLDTAENGDFRTWRLALSPRIFGWCMGDRRLDAALVAVAQVRDANIDWIRVPLSVETIEMFQNVARSNDRAIILSEDRPSAAQPLAEAHARQLGRRLLSLRLEALRAGDDGPQLIRAARREAALLDCQIIAHLETAGSVDGVDFPSVLRLLDDAGSRVIFAVSSASVATVTLHARRACLIHVPAQGRDEQTKMWADALESAGVGESAVMSNIDLLANRFLLTREQVRRSVEESRSLADALDDPASLSERLIESARRYSHDELGGMVERVATTVSWRDVVYSDATMQNIRELITNYRHRERVLLEWGFSRKIPYGKALTAVFWGGTGTGKTLAALLVARELGLELLRVDVSRVFSKYVGETEKNLDHIFRLAERLHAILLFDEADSIFGKRVDAKDSQSRYANLEVNYLLQRLESFDGVAILTTNMLSNCDQAFRRRVRFAVEFPFPDADQRAELWRRMLPQAAPTAPGIAFDILGRDYELPGGHIKNAVLRAAFRAADLNQPIDETLLREAAEGECAAIGRAVRSRPLHRRG